MRPLFILACVCALLSTGCASLIAHSGVNPHALETRDEVHQKFGKPVEAWQAGDESFEVFHTRRKLSDSGTGMGLAMYTMMTWGLGELDTLPYQVFVLADGTVRGQEVRFDYDDFGNVIRRFVPERGWSVSQVVKDAVAREKPNTPPPDK